MTNACWLDVGRSGKSSVSIETFAGNEKDSYARKLGVDQHDIALIAARLKAMRPHIARLWYG